MYVYLSNSIYIYIYLSIYIYNPLAALGVLLMRSICRKGLVSHIYENVKSRLRMAHRLIHSTLQVVSHPLMALVLVLLIRSICRT